MAATVEQAFYLQSIVQGSHDELRALQRPDSQQSFARHWISFLVSLPTFGTFTVCILKAELTGALPLWLTSLWTIWCVLLGLLIFSVSRKVVVRWRGLVLLLLMHLCLFYSFLLGFKDDGDHFAWFNTALLFLHFCSAFFAPAMRVDKERHVLKLCLLVWYHIITVTWLALILHYYNETGSFKPTWLEGLG
jgi:hypothetical protein